MELTLQIPAATNVFALGTAMYYVITVTSHDQNCLSRGVLWKSWHTLLESIADVRQATDVEKQIDKTAMSGNEVFWVVSQNRFCTDFIFLRTVCHSSLSISVKGESQAVHTTSKALDRKSW
jgi:hypothetical protein